MKLSLFALRGLGDLGIEMSVYSLNVMNKICPNNGILLSRPGASFFSFKIRGTFNMFSVVVEPYFAVIFLFMIHVPVEITSSLPKAAATRARFVPS